MVKQPSPPIRLALSGKMRSGKDSTASYLAERYGFARFAFADRLKEVAVELFGMSAARKDRHLLVGLGRKMCEVDQLVWVNCVMSKIPLRADVAISDMRFKYEFHAVKVFGFVTIRIECPREEQIRRVKKCGSAVDLSLLDDWSETDLDTTQHDYIVDGSTYDSIHYGIDDMMKVLGRRPL